MSRLDSTSAREATRNVLTAHLRDGVCVYWFLRRRFLRLGKRIIFVSHCITHAVDSNRASDDDLFMPRRQARSIMLYLAEVLLLQKASSSGMIMLREYPAM